MADENLRMTATVVDGFSRPLTNLRNQLKQTTSAAPRDLKEMESGWRRVTNQIAEHSRALRTVLRPAFEELKSAVPVNFMPFGLAGIGVASLGVAIKGLHDFSGELRDLRVTTKETQLDINVLRAIEKVGEQAGVSAEKMRGAIGVFSNNMLEIKNRWGEVYNSLLAMNLGDLAGKLVAAPNMKAAIDAAFSGLAEIPDPVKRQRVSRMIFGTDDPSKIVALFGGDINKMVEEISQDLTKITPAMEKASEDWERSWQRMGHNLENFKLNTLGPTLKVVNELVEVLQKPITDFLPDFLGGAKAAQGTAGGLGGAGLKSSGGEALTDMQAQLEASRKRLAMLDQGLARAQEGGRVPAQEGLTAARERTVEEIVRLERSIRELSDQMKKANQGEVKAEKQSFLGPALGQPQFQLAGFGGLSRVGAGRLGSMRGAGAGTGGLDEVISPFNPAARTFDAKAPEIANRLQADFQLEPHQVAGILGNLGHESGGFTQMQERGQGAGRGGWGWAQWTGPRRRQFEEYAATNKLDPASDEANYGFLRHELRNRESGAIDALRRTRTREEATATFEHHFERAGVTALQSRLRWADRAAKAMGDGSEPLRTRTTDADAVLRRARDFYTGGQGAQKIEGSASLDININGMRPGMSAKASADGLFKDVNVRQARAMPMMD
jgi:hypothetical protein